MNLNLIRGSSKRISRGTSSTRSSATQQLIHRNSIGLTQGRQYNTVIRLRNLSVNHQINGAI